ncbi:MAG TPA: hypothetical protein VES66_09610 [Terriglobales bacterium]|nr:hypothetical protein [Terriglobales bacterium]
MMRCRKAVGAMLLALLALGTVAATKDKLVDFSGTWKLNMKKSNGAPDWRPDTVLVVLQSPYQIHFAYFLNGDATQPFENHDYVTNGKEAKLYGTGAETAYASVRWTSKRVLQVRMHHVVRSEVADTDWTETDTWTLSDDGKTLINKSSDGKTIVYDKQEKDKVY